MSSNDASKSFFHGIPQKTTIFTEIQWLEDETCFWNGPFFGDILIFRGLLDHTSFFVPENPPTSNACGEVEGTFSDEKSHPIPIRFPWDER